MLFLNLFLALAFIGTVALNEPVNTVPDNPAPVTNTAVTRPESPAPNVIGNANLSPNKRYATAREGIIPYRKPVGPGPMQSHNRIWVPEDPYRNNKINRSLRPVKKVLVNRKQGLN